MFINVLLQAGVLLCGGHGPGGLCGVGYSDGLWKQDPLSAHTAPGAYYPQVTNTGPVSRHTAPNPMCKNWDLFYPQHSHTDKRVGYSPVILTRQRPCHSWSLCRPSSSDLLRRCIGEYNWIFPQGSTWASLLALSQGGLPSLAVFSFLRGRSVTAASLVSVTEINRASPGHVGLGEKPVSVTVCNPLISATYVSLPVSLSSQSLCLWGSRWIWSHRSQLFHWTPFCSLIYSCALLGLCRDTADLTHWAKVLPEDINSAILSSTREPFLEVFFNVH